jgi:sulfur carrier protein
MRIAVNGEPVDVAGPATVGDLLGGGELRGVAVAVNGVVVPRHRHGVHPLADGDVVELVTAVQGG